MRRANVAEFLRDVLTEFDKPDGFEERLVALVDSVPTTRWSRIRDLIVEVTRG